MRKIQRFEKFLSFINNNPEKINPEIISLLEQLIEAFDKIKSDQNLQIIIMDKDEELDKLNDQEIIEKAKLELMNVEVPNFLKERYRYL